MPEAYLLPRLAGHPRTEDILTETVAHLLNRIPAFASEIGLLVFGKRPKRLHAETQVTVCDGRGDLVLEGTNSEDEQIFAVIECKLRADFTPGQPLNYVDHLLGHPAIRRSFGLLLLPEKEAEMSTEALRRLAAIPRRDVGVKWNTPVPDGRIQLSLFTWLDVRKLIESALPHQAIERDRLYCEEAMALIDSQMRYQYRTQPSDQLIGRNIAGMLRDLTELVYRVCNTLGDLASYPSGGADGGVYYGFYVRPTSAPNERLWFGLFVRAWQELGHSPLWVQGKGRPGRWLRDHGGPAVSSLGRDEWVLPCSLDVTGWEKSEALIMERLLSLLGSISSINP